MADKGKQILKKTAFFGSGKITNKAVKYVDSLDKKGVLNTAVKRKEVYRKFKDFGRQGRGLTDKEAKMALAELKYGNDDHLSKKSVDTLGQEMGFGKGKITKKLLRSAKKYKNRGSYTPPSSINQDLKKRAETKIATRREEYAHSIRDRHRAESQQGEVRSIKGDSRLKNTKRKDVRGVRRRLGNDGTTPSTRQMARPSNGSLRPALAGSTHSLISGRSSLATGRPMGAQSRLSKGLRGRFGASHSSVSRFSHMSKRI